MFGVRILVAEGLDYRTSLIVGMGFWVGPACQIDLLFPKHMNGVDVDDGPVGGEFFKAQ